MKNIKTYTNVAVKTRGKTNGYSSHKLWARREKRRLEADIRQGKYDALSTSDKMTQVRKRRGQSKRELARLEKKK